MGSAASKSKKKVDIRFHVVFSDLSIILSGQRM